MLKGLIESWTNTPVESWGNEVFTFAGMPNYSTLEYNQPNMYTVVKKTSIEELIKAVEELMKNGWTVQGGISGVSNMHVVNYCQALVVVKE